MLSQAEIRALTGYARPKFQLEVLKGLGVPARLRPDNTVLVLRMHLQAPPSPAAHHKPEPQLKIIKRPQLKSSRSRGR